jgi:K+-transporting ATPase ATPase C chain
MNRLPVIVRQHIAGFRALLVFTVLCGLIYPAVMVGVAQLISPNHANGSMVSYNGREVGSAVLCQEFADAKGNPLPKYFQPRPSNAVDATSKTDYGCNPLFSAASNLGPNNPDQIKLIKERQQAIAAFDHVSGVADPGGRGDRVGFGPGPGHLAAERGHPGQPRGRGQEPAGVRGQGAGGQVHTGPEARASSASRRSTCSS